MEIATIGTFDGVHAGHQLLLKELGDSAASLGATPLVLVLSPHPLKLVAPERAPKLLTSPEERAALIRRMLPDADVRILDFDSRLRSLTHADFMKMLRDEYGVSALLVGHDNRFGSDRAACYSDYEATAGKLGLGIHICRSLPGVSSSNIRKALAAGDVESAAQMLGRPYALRGIVGHGRRLGRTLGFPTANVVPEDSDFLVPAAGVYAAYVTSSGLAKRAIVNIGVRPTVDNAENPKPSVEAHILDFNGDLYGKSLTIHFCRRLRDEIRFPSTEALADQLRRDADIAESILPPADEKMCREFGVAPTKQATKAL